MDIALVKNGIISEHHAALKMFRQCVELCPGDLWVGGTHPRNYWRIVYHTLHYTHMYLHQKREDWSPQPFYVEGMNILWDNPAETAALSQEQLLGYTDLVMSSVEPLVQALDIETDDSGVPWYSCGKYELLLVNLRHIQGHVGQLSELLMARGIDIDWEP